MTETSDTDILYFCDESSHIGDPFMAVGGMAVRRKNVPIVLSKLDDIRKACNFTSEVKWSKAKRRRSEVHKQYAEAMATFIEDQIVQCHIRFAPFNEYDHRQSGPRGRKDTVGKMYFQLLLHRPVTYYGKSSNIYVYPDGGDCTEQLAGQIGALCYKGIAKGASGDCVKVIEQRSSDREPMLQLLDVTLGAMTARRNERELGDFKAELCDHIMALHGNIDLSRNSPMANRSMNIWNAIPSKRGP